jgi:hypothetical protein
VALAEPRQAPAAAGAPEDVLRLLDGPGSPGEIVQRLIGAGLAPSPPDSAAALVSQWEPLLVRGTDPLDAELSGAEFLALLRRGAADPDDLPDMLTTLVAQAEQHGGPAALAMLRALAVMAPERVRDQAGAAADRLAAAGLPDRPWVAQLGAPKLSTCFGYSDGIAQEAVAITFRYGRKRHAVAVLIAYGLGGGVKDVWVTDRPGQVRAAYQDSADRIGVEIEDYEPAAARAILELALSKPPLPGRAGPGGGRGHLSGPAARAGGTAGRRRDHPRPGRATTHPGADRHCAPDQGHAPRQQAIDLAAAGGALERHAGRPAPLRPGSVRLGGEPPVGVRDPAGLLRPARS